MSIENFVLITKNSLIRAALIERVRVAFVRFNQNLLQVGGYKDYVYFHIELPDILIREFTPYERDDTWLEIAKLLVIDAKEKLATLGFTLHKNYENSSFDSERDEKNESYIISFFVKMP